MILIIGLGNPGRRYRNTPHNLGFDVIDLLRRRHRLPRFRRRGVSLVTAGEISGTKTLLVKPITFMNRSGQALAELAEEPISAEKIWLVHDDADLPLGEVKKSAGRGSGGHKGVASVISALQTKQFLRWRIGAAAEGRDQLKEFVLQPYGRDQRSLAKQAVKQAAIEIEESLAEKDKTG